MSTISTSSIPNEANVPSSTADGTGEDILAPASSMPILAGIIAALVVVMNIQQQMTKTDSETSTQVNSEANTIVAADNKSTQAMSAVISSQNTDGSSSSTTTNTNLQEAQQVESTQTALFQSQQEFMTSQGTIFTNLTSGPDSNNMKTDGTVGNLVLQILSKLSSLLGTYY
ncbi:MAG: hypothetical protein V4494_06865 [Chlamydiota bacterium]